MTVMESTTQSNPQPTSLKATYNAPTATKSFSYTLSSSASVSSTKEKTQYLSSLRTSVGQLQDDINEFLTGKMEEDKALAAGSGKKIDDKAEEENYGEEVAGDES